jgi:hypothetical protein
LFEAAEFDEEPFVATQFNLFSLKYGLNNLTILPVFMSFQLFLQLFLVLLLSGDVDYSCAQSLISDLSQLEGDWSGNFKDSYHANKCFLNLPVQVTITPKQVSIVINSVNEPSSPEFHTMSYDNELYITVIVNNNVIINAKKLSSLGQVSVYSGHLGKDIAAQYIILSDPSHQYDNECWVLSQPAQGQLVLARAVLPTENIKVMNAEPSKGWNSNPVSNYPSCTKAVLGVAAGSENSCDGKALDLYYIQLTLALNNSSQSITADFKNFIIAVVFFSLLTLSLLTFLIYSLRSRCHRSSTQQNLSLSIDSGLNSSLLSASSDSLGGFIDSPIHGNFLPTPNLINSPGNTSRPQEFHYNPPIILDQNDDYDTENSLRSLDSLDSTLISATESNFNAIPVGKGQNSGDFGVAESEDLLEESTLPSANIRSFFEATGDIHTAESSLP